MKQLRHFKVDKANDGVLWIGIDCADAGANTINSEVLEELQNIIESIKHDCQLKGAVIYSNKSSGFIMGADIKCFSQFKETNEAVAFIEQGQQVFNQLSNLSIPTIAMINGVCVGGGLELALACRYRVAVLDAKCGLPEVKLGIQPGWGGSIRLIRRIGPFAAFNLMLTGRLISAKVAKRLGFIEAAVPLRNLKRAAQQMVFKPPKVKHRSVWYQIFKLKPLRMLAAYFVAKQVRSKALKKHYPAPYLMIDNWVQTGDNLSAGLKAECQGIIQLIQTPTAKNLIRLFFLQERLKHLANPKANQIAHVHVLGAGVMGADIAAWCALKGFKVTVEDPDHQKLADLMARAQKLFKKKFKDRYKVQDAFDRLIADPKGLGAGDADLVIEAIVEDLTIKQTVLKNLESKVKNTAIIATNTSSIRLKDLTEVLVRAERLVGIHFFNPVAMMQLVEVVAGPQTDEQTFAKSLQFVLAIAKLPVPVQDSPGFVVNRILLPYLAEAFKMVEEGVAYEQIDNAARAFGMPMGPIELADTIGLDICVNAAKNILPQAKLPEKLLNLVQAKHLGQKTKRGFYRYRKGKPAKRLLRGEPQPELQDRLILSMINEAVKCLDEGIIQDSDLLDAAMIFGSGFAPCQGGPIHYALKEGVEKIKMRLKALTDRYGDRFIAHQFLNELG